MKRFQSENKTPLSAIVAPILDWYDANARILPWRENRDPYRVWVSEIMLQQTRVETVRPYFERFMKALPTIQDLAAASDETLLKLWEGLGYYARVRNLQKAAQAICDQLNGIFPQQYEEILSLPGIGEYTAGAISSISFEKPVAAVDGNVLRVITRITENYHDIGDAAFKRHIKSVLEAAYPISRCGDFTQSLMELGAVVCKPNGFPECERCPVNFLCMAYQHQTQAELPVKSAKKPRKILQKTVFLLRSGEQIAIRKREDGGLLGGLWEFPNTQGLLSEEEARRWLEKQGLDVGSLTKSERKKHIFTHVEWHMESYAAECAQPLPPFTWVTGTQLEKQIALPTAFKKFEKVLKDKEAFCK